VLIRLTNIVVYLCCLNQTYYYSMLSTNHLINLGASVEVKIYLGVKLAVISRYMVLCVMIKILLLLHVTCDYLLHVLMNRLSISVNGVFTMFLKEIACSINTCGVFHISGVNSSFFCLREGVSSMLLV
jgi:hypothetical protein